MVGPKFGRWTVLSQAASVLYERDGGLGTPHEHRRWLCLCTCGTEKEVAELALRSGRSISCGCYNRERSAAKHTTHGATAGGRQSAEYSTWKAMLARCYNPNNKRYKDYGGRGIGVCDEWKESFSTFLHEVGLRPSPRHSIDRIHNDRGYEPGNCKWSEPHEQMINRRKSYLVEVDQGRIALSDLAKGSGIPANTLRARLELGWTVDRATSVPVRQKRPNGAK